MVMDYENLLIIEVVAHLNLKKNTVLDDLREF